MACVGSELPSLLPLPVPAAWLVQGGRRGPTGGEQRTCDHDPTAIKCGECVTAWWLRGWTAECVFHEGTHDNPVCRRWCIASLCAGLNPAHVRTANSKGRAHAGRVHKSTQKHSSSQRVPNVAVLATSQSLELNTANIYVPACACTDGSASCGA